MLRYLPEFKGQNEIKAKDEFNEMLRQGSPRPVPKELLELLIPATYRVGRILSGIFLILIVSALIAAAVLSLFNIKPLWFLVVGSDLFLFFLVAFGIFLWGKNVLRKQLRILREGECCEGKIGKISPWTTRANGYSFFHMDVIFMDPFGREVTVRETVRSDIVDRFFAIKDEDNRLDILYDPNVARTIVIPLKLIYLARYA